MERLLKVIRAICQKPGIYVGQPRMPLVRSFLLGYVIALGESKELENDPFGSFLRWLEAKHGICHPGWGWDRILTHAAGSDKEAIRTLPEQFELYLTELSNGTFDLAKSV